MVFTKMRAEMAKMGGPPSAVPVAVAARMIGVTPAQLDAMARAALIGMVTVGKERQVPMSEVFRHMKR